MLDSLLESKMTPFGERIFAGLLYAVLAVMSAMTALIVVGTITYEYLLYVVVVMTALCVITMLAAVFAKIRKKPTARAFCFYTCYVEILLCASIIAAIYIFKDDVVWPYDVLTQNMLHLVLPPIAIITIGNILFCLLLAIRKAIAKSKTRKQEKQKQAEMKATENTKEAPNAAPATA